MLTSYRRKLLKYIPPSLRHRIVELKNALWGGYRHISYAHCGEDVYVNAFFRSKKKGFYVDVGAHHPKRYSNTALLYERGWNGINVDPDSYLIKAFVKQRKRDINLNYGVALVEGELSLHRFSDPAVNTFSAENAERLKSKSWLEEVAVEKIKVRPLVDIFREYVYAKKQIDFLNIDVEDLDMEVIQSNDWNVYRPTMVAVEDRLFNPIHPDTSDIYTYLTERGYIFIAYLGLTLVLVEKSYIESQLNKK